MPSKLPQRAVDPDPERHAVPSGPGLLRRLHALVLRLVGRAPPEPDDERAFADSRGAAPLPLVTRQRAELGARLLVHDPATQVVRHLVIVHDTLRGGGWQAVEALPTAVIARAVTEAEIMASDEPSPLLATILETLQAIRKDAAEREAREARAALEAEWEIPQMPEVSDTNFDEYELMERSWAGTVPSDLRQAIRDTR